MYMCLLTQHKHICIYMGARRDKRRSRFVQENPGTHDTGFYWLCVRKGRNEMLPIRRFFYNLPTRIAVRFSKRSEQRISAQMRLRTIWSGSKGCKIMLRDMHVDMRIIRLQCDETTMNGTKITPKGYIYP